MTILVHFGSSGVLVIHVEYNNESAIVMSNAVQPHLWIEWAILTVTEAMHFAHI